MLRCKPAFMLATLTLLISTACSNNAPSSSTSSTSPNNAPSNPITAPIEAAKSKVNAAKEAATNAANTAQEKTAEVMKTKEAFDRLQSVVTSTKADVEKGDFTKAKQDFDKFEESWSKVEDGVKAKSGKDYKDIEESMSNVAIALKSADQAKAQAALQSLQKAIVSSIGKF